MRGHILREDNIPTLTATFFRVMHVFTEVDVSSSSSIGHSAIYSGRGRGRGRGRDYGGGRGLVGTGRSFPGGRQSAPDKGPQHCKHCGRSNHISKKCWVKFD